MSTPSARTRGLTGRAAVWWQDTDVDRRARATLNGHRPCVVWFTGVSGAGKSTIANALERRLHADGVHTYLLDGDNLRCGLNSDLGFTAADRAENVRRVAEVARLMVDAGLVVLVAVVSPFAADREAASALLEQDEFYLVHVDTPVEVAARRDPKGLYAKARQGLVSNLTGVHSPYEVPENPRIRIDTTTSGPTEAAAEIHAVLVEGGVVDPSHDPCRDEKRTAAG